MKNLDIKVSPAFKAQTTKALWSIFLFVLTYIVMLAAAVGLTALCVYAGFMIIVAKPMLITLGLGIGLASLGVLVLFFLLKFIFKSNKTDRSHLIEITRSQEPQLFNLIDQIVQKVGTSFPKKVYLSADVNAAVFYDSNFWSMFFPVKKNLQIGLGLVNSVSKSEFTAILSHEFGHFSQRTMKVGSFVYNVNQVIFNLLYDNQSYDEMIQKWANSSGYFSIFVLLAVKIVDGIKRILSEMYKIVNKSYLALSREMEFNADEIAAHVTGYEPLKTSLLRMSLADHAYGSVMSFYQGKSGQVKSANFYRDHSFVMQFLAGDNKLEVVNGLPQISESELNKYNKSKLVITDQWASHPSTDDRIRMLEKTGLTAESIDNGPANELFGDINQTQIMVTDHLFLAVDPSGALNSIPSDTFAAEFQADIRENQFPKIFKGYYDEKNPIPFDTAATHNEIPAKNLAELFSDSMLDMVYTSIALKNDIETIRQISDKQVDIKTFDYDGVKYRKTDCAQLTQKMENELELLNNQIMVNDQAIYSYFKSRETVSADTSELGKLYLQFFEFDKEFDSRIEIYTLLSTRLEFIQVTTPVEKITANFREIDEIEQRLKEQIRKLLEDDLYHSVITEDIREIFNLYLAAELRYFSNDKYIDADLEILFNAMHNYAYILSRGYFLFKKKLLNYQAGLVEANAPSRELV